MNRESVPTAIEFRSVTFSVGGRRLVGPVDLQVQSGETLVLVGASGSGKTTTLRLINRLIDPTSGELRVDGRRTVDWDPIALRRRIGYVIQEVGLFPHMSVAANVGLVPRLVGTGEADIADRVNHLLDLVGLPHDDFASRYPHQLSGGQRQRVGVARALAVDPPFLLCDEPFGAVDPITRSELQREFKSLATRLGKTILFVTHDVREALRLADRIALFEDGTMPFLGNINEFAASPVPAVVSLRSSVA